MSVRSPRGYTAPPQPAPEAGSDDDLGPGDGLEPGARYEPAAQLSQQERASAARFQRIPEQQVEKEWDPLPGLQKVITTGKDLLATRKHMLAPGLEGMCASVNPAGDTVAVACRNNTLLLLDTALQPLNSLDLSGEVQDGTITAMTYRPETSQASTQNVALVAQNEQVLCVHTSTGQVLSRRKEQGNKINCIALRGAEGTALATAGSDTVVRVYDEPTGKLCANLNYGDDVMTTGHSNAVFSVAWCPDDPNLLVSGGWDRSVKVWDLRMVRAVRSMYGPMVCGDSVSVRGDRVLTGSWRHAQSLQQWELSSGRLMTNMTFHQAEHEACLIYCAKFGEGNLDGLAFAGGSGKQPCLRVFKARGEVVGTLKLGASMVGLAQVAHAPKQKSVVACCSDRVVLLDV